MSDGVENRQCDLRAGGGEEINPVSIDGLRVGGGEEINPVSIENLNTLGRREYKLETGWCCEVSRCALFIQIGETEE